MSKIVEVRDFQDHIGEEVVIAGWVETTRSHGKIGFVVVRDGTGVVQCVVLKKQVDEEAWETFSELAQETSLRITGELKEDDRAPGGYEITASSIDVILDGEYRTSVNVTVVDADTWGPNDVARVRVSLSDGLDPGDHRVKVIVNGDEEVLEFHR